MTFSLSRGGFLFCQPKTWGQEAKEMDDPPHNYSLVIIATVPDCFRSVLK